jgi:ABC-2 type transport system ATP-binding protein/ribosome-dependent ATPase
MTALIEVDKVTKRFADVTAIDSVSLSVESGEVVGLLGANGAGKTTLMRMILGLIRPEQGSVRLFGHVPTREARSRLGYVPQSTGLYQDLTVAENLAFVSAAFHVPMPSLDPELLLVANRPLSEVSLGLRRRAAFAAALSHDPGLLVLDEPTSGVGPLGRVELWNTIGEQADGGTGVLVSTHHMDEAEQCDRIVMLASGRKAAEGTAAEIVESVQAVEVNVGDWHQAFTALERAGFRPTLVGSRVRLTEVDPKRVEGILSDSGLDASVRPVQAGFEEAFVALAST